MTREIQPGKKIGKPEGEYICYGLIDATGVELVPHCHPTPEEAIGELVYFMRLNLKRKFLAEDFTAEEIDKIEADLLSTFGNTQLSLFQ